MKNFSLLNNVRDNVVIGIQARMSSKRLPGKSLMPLSDTTILGATIKRCIASRLKTYVLTSKEKDDDRIENESRKFGVSDVLRGSLKNVLSRFQMLVDRTNAEYIIRVTADNPFTDSLGIINLANSTKDNKFQYLIHCENELPIGYHCELFHSSELFRNFNNNDLAREHVTYSIKRNVNISYAKSLNYEVSKKCFEYLNCTIDEKKDYLKAIELTSKLDINESFDSLNLTKTLMRKITNKIYL